MHCCKILIYSCFYFFKIIRKHFSFFLLISVFFFSSAHSHGNGIGLKQALSYRHFGEEDGLATKTVYVMMQDHHGFIWFATDAGVYRYDGRTFKQYTMRDGLSDNEVMNLAEDSKGRIWFLTFNGKLSFWKEGKIYNEQQVGFLKQAFLGQLPSTFYEDNKGRIWIGCKMAGLIIIDDTIVTKKTFPDHPREYVGPYVFEAKDKSIRYLYRDKLINLSTNDTMHLSEIALFFSPVENKMAGYYASYGGIYFINGFEERKILDLKMEVGDRRVINFICVDNAPWLCKLGSGVYQLNESGIVNHYLENSTVINVLKDREGNLWFSTMDDGVYMLSNTKDMVRNYNLSSGLSDDRVFSIDVDNNRSLLLGYSNGTIDKINGTKISNYILRRKDEPEYLRVKNIKFINDTIWCGDDAGLKFIYKEKVNFVQNEKGMYALQGYTVKDIYFDGKNEIYVANHRNIYKVIKNHAEYFLQNLSDTIFRTFSLAKLNDTEFLVSTMHGLIVFVPGKSSYPFFTDSAYTSIRTVDMEFDNDSILYLATIDKGLFVVKGREIVQHLTVADGLSDENCKRVFLKDNKIFLATANGLTILVKNDNQKWYVKKKITIRDGILSNVVNDVIVFENNIYLATEKGLSVVSNSFTSSAKYKTKIVITDIITDTILNPFDTSFSVSADASRLIIKFAYPVFNQSNKTGYEYKLTSGNSGSEDWIQTTNNEVEFSSLQPGKFLFEIRPTNVTNARSTRISYVILPKWWQTWWSKVLFAGIISLIIFQLLRMRFKIQYERKISEMKQQSLIESERSRIASDMHDDIGSDLTQISLWMNILRSYELKENETINKISRLSEDVLAKMGQIIWALDSMHNSSANLFSFLREYFSKTLEVTKIKFEYRLNENMPEFKVTSFQRRNIFLIMKELLNNSIKHSGCHMIKVDINIKDNVMEIDYSDDGKGFDVNKNFEGHGLISMRKRVEEIEGKIVFECQPQKGFVCNIIVVV